MKDYSKESDARIVIDELLRQAKWDPADKSQVLTEFTVRGYSEAVSEESLSTHYNNVDGDEIPTGRADYVLLNQNGRPLAVIEAKRACLTAQLEGLFRAPRGRIEDAKATVLSVLRYGQQSHVARRRCRL